MGHFGIGFPAVARRAEIVHEIPRFPQLAVKVAEQG